MSGFTDTHFRVTHIELAAKLVSELGAQYRWTPGLPACDEERAIRLFRFNEAVDNLKMALEVKE